jgi:FkbM family methyltransferase
LGEREFSLTIRRKALGVMFGLIPPDWRKKIGCHLGAPDLRWSLMQLRRYGFSPKNIMDVGAFRGDWTKIYLEVFPEAYITCIEPQDAYREILDKFAEKHSNIRIIQALLGKKVDRAVNFSEVGSGSGVLVDSDPSTIAVRPMTTIDTLVTDGICKPPQLLKLDVQGYEIEVLEGFSQHLDQCEVIQCELSLLPIAFGAPLIHEVLTYLYKRGFVMFDITELIRAPSDGCVWQIDALFCRMDSPLRRERAW